MSASENRVEELPYRVEKVIDARGMMCPGPVLMLSSAISQLPSGAVVMVLARDPAFEEDLRSWAIYTGNKIIEIRRDGENIIAYVRKR
ncbi:MAG: sulfurtransferase TusA family protein [Sulfolobales archaeon]